MFFVFLCGLFLPGIASAQQPSAAEAKDALVEFGKRVGKVPASEIEVKAVVGCYPIANRPSTDVICLLDAKNNEGKHEVGEIPFSRSNSRWSVLSAETSYSPACPPKAEAESILRQSLHDPKTTVTDVPEEGNLTDQRGMNRDKSGPMRLMCVYGVDGALGERTVVGYFQFEAGKYLLDADAEVWSD